MLSVLPGYQEWPIKPQKPDHFLHSPPGKQGHQINNIIRTGKHSFFILILLKSYFLPHSSPVISGYLLFQILLCKDNSHIGKHIRKPLTDHHTKRINRKWSTLNLLRSRIVSKNNAIEKIIQGEIYATFNAEVILTACLVKSICKQKTIMVNKGYPRLTKEQKP